PTISFNVPRGYDVLMPYLEKDEQLRDNFFKNLDMLFYAAAALPPALWAKLEELSIKARGDRVPMISSWGSTETAPAAATVHWLIEKAGVIGVPLPGTEIKLAPSGTKMELRVRGANVTPGYWRRPELNDEAFDEEGFFKMGDAGKLEDPDDPAKGLVFDGRTAENFKLMSGTWVHAGELRLKAIDAGWPVVADAVLTGHDREEIGLLIFPNAAGCASLVKDGGAAAGTDCAAGGARGAEGGLEETQRREQRQQPPLRLCADHGRAALDRRQRDHRQGLREPARRARQPPGSGGEDLCRRRSRCDRDSVIEIA
ncbi:MAG: AMP-binding protein, partial [Alphaproteobacteria bacterium]